MKLIERKDVTRKPLPGRVIQLVTGASGAISHSDVITMGFARYSAESGPMEPHHHVEEIVYILESKDGYVRHGGFGEKATELGERIVLKPGMILHFPAFEWHVFEYEEGGCVDIIFYYSDPGVYTNSLKKE
jgi:mannose-6-phosphate isomerase-like protein (cupin superfamily)